MKNKAIKGLAGIILAGNVLSNIYSQENPSTLFNNSEFSKEKYQKDISYQRINLYGKSYLVGANQNPIKDELEIFISPEEYLVTSEIISKNPDQIYASEYVLTLVRGLSDSLPIKTIYNFPLEQKIKVRSKKTSKNSSGYAENVNKAITENYNPLTLNGQKFLCVTPERTMSNRRNFDFTQNGIPLMFVPYEKDENEITRVNSNSTLDLFSTYGIYQPRLRESGYNGRFPSEKKSDYERYLEQKEKNAKENIQNKNGSCYYTVKKGDTLWKIAGKEADKIYKLNPEINPKTNLIKEGQKIKVPCE